MGKPTLKEYRTKQETIQAIFTLLKRGATTPSHICKELGLFPKTLDDHLEYIQYIQSKPPIQVAGRNRLITLKKIQ